MPHETPFNEGMKLLITVGCKIDKHKKCLIKLFSGCGKSRFPCYREARLSGGIHIRRCNSLWAVLHLTLLRESLAQYSISFRAYDPHID